MANVKMKIDETPENTKFSFSKSFNDSFNALINAYSDSLNDLNKTMGGKDLSAEYGVCAQKYNLRYITPENISTFIGNLVKAVESGMFHDRIADTAMFTVASVKRFIEENGCPSFESSVMLSDSKGYVNPKDWTLNDIAFICKNDVGDVSLYSKGEMQKRLDLMKEDVAKMNNMHFAANIKNIVKALPNVLKGTYFDRPSMGNIFGAYLEEFLLFTCTLNTIAVLQLLAYGNPSVEYTTKPKDDDTVAESAVITESCLYKCNDFIIRNRIPFNCNIRDVVLQDVTPDFADTHDAIHFLLKDGRSPISVLVAKYAPKNKNICDDKWIISKIFLGGKCYDGGDCDIHRLKDDKLVDGATVHGSDGFDTSVKWLDTIAFGNNYLDGNFRRDAMGNNHVHPIVNTLDMLYRVYGSVDLKTNEELAENIIRVSGAIRGIISDYRTGGPIDNYVMVKDILALLGEILTRDILHLYYNNTRVIVYSDDMPDAMAPGFVMEAFVMEADENAEGNKAGTPKPTVTVTDASGNEKQLSTSVKIQNTIQKFIQWIRNNLDKFAPKFNENHKKEIEWVNNNKALNDEIKQAIADKKFNPIVHNLPKFNVPKEFVNMPADKFTKLFEPYLTNEALNNGKASKEYSDTTLLKAFVTTLNGDDNAIKSGEGSAEENAKVITNLVLYGKTEAPQVEQNEALTDTRWDGIIDDITGTPRLIDMRCKAFSKDLQTVLNNIGKMSNEYNGKAETEQNSVQYKNAKESLDLMRKEVENLNKTVVTASLTAIAKKMYSTNYTVYRAIVMAYKQQTKSGATSAPVNTTNNNVESTATPTETPAET